MKRVPEAFENFLDVLREEPTYHDLSDMLENTRGEIGTSRFISLATALSAATTDYCSHTTCTSARFKKSSSERAVKNGGFGKAGSGKRGSAARGMVIILTRW